jgi:hypothetical protein
MGWELGRAAKVTVKAFLPGATTRTELKEEILDDPSGYWAMLAVVRHDRRY